MSVSLSLPSMHHKKYYYSMLPCLQLGSMCYFSSTHSATPHIWAFIDKDRAFTLHGRLNEMGVYSRRVFNDPVVLSML